MENSLLIPALPTLAATSLLPSLPLISRERRAAYPLDLVKPGDGRARLYYLARNGIFHGLRALGVGPGDVVLMPSYHHGVEVEAVRHTGAGVAFYRVDARMQADLDDVARLAMDPRVKALYLTHIAGWPQPTDEAAALCRARNLLLVEDCALALYSRDEQGRWLGQTGDLSVFCLYKTLPVPHGGIAIARVPLPEGRTPPLLSTLHHLGGAALARAAVNGGSVVRSLRDGLRALTRRTIDKVAPPVKTGTQHLRTEELWLGASSTVERIVRSIDAESVVTRRRRNFTTLLDALGDDARVPTGAPPPGTSPLFFPLALPPSMDRRAALEGLWSRGVEAIDFWSFGDPACRESDFPETMVLRRSVIEIPLHQDLDDEQMERVAHSVKDVLAHA